MSEERHNTKSKFIQVRVTEDDKRALAEISEKLDRPVSQIIRESWRAKVAEILDKEELAAAK